ncbi:MAG: DinB family protein [Anaerolineales bacterium]
MNLILLLDLDDTLLDTNMDAFLAAYFQSLSSYLSPYLEPQMMLSALIKGTQKMMIDLDPRTTLREVFDPEFFPNFDIDRDELTGQIDKFYNDVFPSLQNLTNKNDDAVSFVEWAIERGCRLAIATNPLFPLAAIHHRMRWAGLPPEKYPFEVVSAYEEFHFSKPNAAYYAEIAARMGWPDGPIIVVGNDINADLIPAQVLGFSTFWIVTENADSNGFKPTAQGTLADLRPWLEKTDLSTLEPDLSTPEALIALLISTPAAISGLLPCLSEPRSNEAGEAEQASGPNLKRRPVSDEWCLTEVLCHLRDTEIEINLPRLHMLMELDEPFIPARNTDKWAVERDYKNQDAISAFDDFLSARIQMIDALSSLTDEWQRKARHAIFGPTDLLELVKFMAEHDKLHIRQIYTTIEQLKEQELHN